MTRPPATALTRVGGVTSGVLLGDRFIQGNMLNPYNLTLLAGLEATLLAVPTTRMFFWRFCDGSL